MYTAWQRCNTVLTFTGTVLAVLCLFVSATDLFHKADPKVELTVKSVRKLFLDNQRNDVAVLSFNLDADLRSVFSWNTKQIFVYVQAEYPTEDFHINQVSIWDQIVQSKEKAHIQQKRIRQEYPLADHGRNLRGHTINLTLTWDVMPKVGFLYSGSMSFPGFTLPDEYKW